jgi:hypothetical protein
MKTNSLIIGLVVGMLAASSASAFPSGTQGHNYKYPAQPTASQVKSEVQVAIMAQSPLRPGETRTEIQALCPTVSIWYGTGSSTRATHSH